jgi:uncharacterized membrane protein YcgQ (UPF0703/DUF1980 family)
LIKFFRLLLEFVQLIGFFAFFGTISYLYLLLLYLFIVPLTPIIHLIWIKVGTHGTYQVDGIKLSRSNKKFRRLISWQEIKELKKPSFPPFVRFEVLLHSNEVITVDFIEEDLSIILEELELRNIPCIDFVYAKD